jgi:hypothetical protein
LLAATLSALVLSGCGITVTKSTGRGRVSDPRTEAGRLQCLRAHRLAVTAVGSTGLQVGQPPGGPTIRFVPMPGAAQADQIAGLTQGAEVIGSALLYPNQASDSELKVIENCMGRGVKEPKP